MRIDIYHHFVPGEEVPAWAKHLLGLTEKIMASVTDIQADVAAESTVIDSAITLLKGLADALKAAGTDPAALSQLHTDITAKTQALADAVAANTPAAPPAP